MTDQVPDGAAVDPRLRARRDAFVLGIAEQLDIDSGLSEVLITHRHERLVRDLRGNLDINAGLADILNAISIGITDTPIALRDMADHGSVDWVDRKLATMSLRLRLLLRADFAAYLSASADLVKMIRADTSERILEIGQAHSHDVSSLAFDEVRRQLSRLFSHGGPGRAGRGDPYEEEWVASVGNYTFSLVDRARAGIEDRSALRDPCPVLNELETYLRTLGRLLNDFTHADLRDTDLNGVSLDGVRWSAATTRWPDRWREQIQRDSVPIRKGIFEIRYGTKKQQDSLV